MVGSILIGVIYLIRMFIRKKVNPIIIYYMWILVIVKLIVPYGPESELSIYNIFHNNMFDSTEQSIEEFANNELEINNNEILSNNSAFIDEDIKVSENNDVLINESIGLNEERESILG